MHQHKFCPDCGSRVYSNRSCCGNSFGSIGGSVFGGSAPGQLGVDLSDGDLTVGLGGGLVEDLSTGDIELQIAPGIDLSDGLF